MPRLWKICQHKVSQIVYSHEHESCWKVKLCLEYCEHLLYFHLISLDQKDLEKNHREFLSAVRQCLRLMKKFYSMSMAKHIPKLKTIILSSVSLCEEHLPFKDFKVLNKLTEIVAPAVLKEKTEFKLEAEGPMLQKVVEKILGSWKVVEKRRKLFSSKAFADFYKQLEHRDASKKMQCESNESKISPKLKRDKLELRSKKSKSLQL